MTMNNNVILSRSEGSHNIEILRSLCSLRMTWGKELNVFSLSKGEGQGEGFITNLRNELIKKPSPAFVVFANAQTQLLPLTKREGNKKRKELINLSTYPPINFNKIFPRPLRERARERGKKAAFTLAEVLITLGIIGVVAAMTIPTLMTHFQQEQTVIKLKKAISVINQAYRLSYDDVGEPEDSYTIGADEYFKTYWAPYIKVLHYCSTYKDCGYKSNMPWSYANGSSSDTGLVYPNKRTTFYSMDGILYVVFTAAGPDDNIGADYRIYVDINGGQGPNIYGRDLFVLTRVQENGGGVRPYGYEQSDTNINKNCSKTGTGGYCAEKIRRAGWKIEKDYPW